MCLLMEQPKGTTLSRAEIADFVKCNPDGAGFAWGDGEKLHIVKVLAAADVDRVYRASAAGRHAVLHFRMATHGGINLENTHPYRLTRDIAVAHNGVLSCGNPVDETRSDTWHLAEYMLKPLAEKTPEMLFTEEYAAVLGALIGSNNKLAFIHADGRVQLVNADSGVWYRERWYSNTYAWDAPASLRRVVYGGRYYGGYGRWEDDWRDACGSAAAADGQRALALQTTDSRSASATDLPTVAPEQWADDATRRRSAWGAMRRGWSEDGVDGIAAAIFESPADCALALAAWLPAYVTEDADEYQTWIEDNPEDVATWVADAFMKEIEQEAKDAKEKEVQHGTR